MRGLWKMYHHMPRPYRYGNDRRQDRYRRQETQVKNKSRDPREVISKISLSSFPQAKRVGNPSDSPLEKGDEGGCLRKIPDKPE